MNNISAYVKPIITFFSAYIACLFAVQLAVTFGIQLPKLSILLILFSSWLSVRLFIIQNNKLPTKKDAIVLSLGSCFLASLVVVVLGVIYGVSFNLSVFLLQFISILCMAYVVYGVIAPRFFKALLKTKSQVQQPNSSKAWEELYGPPQPPKSTISLKDYEKTFGQLPLPDRSNIKRNFSISRGQLDLSWGQFSQSINNVSRPVLVEHWADEGHITCVTLFLSRVELEEITAEQLITLFIKSGLIKKNPNAAVIHNTLIRIVDRQDHPIWSLNLVLAHRDEYNCQYVGLLKSYNKSSEKIGVHSYSACIVCGESELNPIVSFGRGVPHNNRNHKHVYDYHAISECTKCGNGQLEIFSHDCWSPENSEDMYWWLAIKPEDLRMLINLASNHCTQPNKVDCDCEWHKELGKIFKSSLINTQQKSVNKAYMAQYYSWVKMSIQEGCLIVEQDIWHGIIQVKK